MTSYEVDELKAEINSLSSRLYDLEDRLNRIQNFIGVTNLVYSNDTLENKFEYLRVSNYSHIETSLQNKFSIFDDIDDYTKFLLKIISKDKIKEFLIEFRDLYNNKENIPFKYKILLDIILDNKLINEKDFLDNEYEAYIYNEILNIINKEKMENVLDKGEKNG